MANIIKIKRGLDIPFPGTVASGKVLNIEPELCAIVPDDFPGFRWKLSVKPGDSIAQGAELMQAKEVPAITLVAPIGGTVVEVRRGERRKIEAVVIKSGAVKADKKTVDVNAYQSLKADDATALIDLMCENGLWALMRQRPYDVVPNPAVKPRDIFVTAFDSAPLAPQLIDSNMYHDLEKGLEALSLLTSGRVYLSVPYDSDITSRVALVNEVAGPHPAGNTGPQIAAIKPVNKGETVWTLDARTAVRIGYLLRTGLMDNRAEVAVTGPEAESPCMVNTKVGAAIAPLIKNNVKQLKDLRVISGNILTGIKTQPADGFLRFPYRQLTLMKEGAAADEFMGWASLSPKKYSVKSSFLSALLGKKKGLNFDSRVLGGRRAHILSGEYDKVFPFDIYPEFLLRAIEAGDIDKMEQLGIYEVAAEDFALPEFVDTSKMPLQAMVKEALLNLRAELES